MAQPRKGQAMSKQNQNPYRKGTSYAGTFDSLRKAGQKGISKENLVKDHPVSDVNVVLSPRPEGWSKGDCRGNYSAKGEFYFVTPSKKKGVPTMYRFGWRKKVLEPHKRVREIVKSSKVAKDKKQTKAIVAK
jgi:hypothetical protein